MKRYWDIPSILLLVAALWVAALRLWVTDWTENLERVELLVMFGLVIGLALGKSKFTPRATLRIAFLYSLFIVPWQMGVIMNGDTWNERLSILIRRLNDTTWTVLHNQPVQDPILFLFSMCLLFWLVSLIASYQLIRYGRPWMPVAVASLGVMLIEYYHPYLTRGSLLTGMFVFFVLMLIGRMHYVFTRDRWVANNVSVDAEAGFDLSRGTIAAGLLLVVMAWNFPTVMKAITPGTQEHQWVQVSWDGVRHRLSNIVTSLRSPVTVSGADFGNSMGLGTGTPQGNANALLITPNKPIDPSVRLYWRGRTYDSYRNGDWANTISQVKNFTANTIPFVYPTWSPTVRVSVTIKNEGGATRMLYSPGLPVTTNRAGQAQVQQVSEDQVDVVSLLTTPALKIGDTYTIEGNVSVPSIKQLREAPAAYPDWVKNLYLQLPPDFSPKIKELAQQLTVGDENQFDKVAAITDWLRNNMTYSTSIPTPPADQDPLEWFLFTYKKGFCNYYASAEVVMLRSIGIPARLAVGYAEGQPQENGKWFLVQQKDSHAWPEVYFYGAGWVPFEPTVSQPATQLPAGDNASQAANDPGSNSLGPLGPNGRPLRDRDLEGPLGQRGLPANTPVQTFNFPYEWVALVALIMLAIALIVFWRYQQQRGRWRPLPQELEQRMRRGGMHPPDWLQAWSRFTELSPIERVFAGVRLMVRFLGGASSASQTPQEQINTLTTLVPDSQPYACVVLEEYQRSIYSPYPANIDNARRASRLLWQQAARSWFRRHFGVEIQVTQ